jgi:hypothetical protein
MGALRVLLGAGCRDSDSMLRGAVTFAVCLMAKTRPVALPAGFSERVSGCGGPDVRPAQFAVQHVPGGIHCMNTSHGQALGEFGD